MNRLKPCPFCGKADAARVEDENTIYYITENDGDYKLHPHYCICCGVPGGGCGGASGFHKTAEEAISAWNNRAEGWVSVEDRLPEVDEYGDVNVLVCMDDGFITSATYDENNGWELWAEAGEVTHWQPLPQPPTEDTK